VDAIRKEIRETVPNVTEDELKSTGKRRLTVEKTGDDEPVAEENSRSFFTGTCSTVFCYIRQFNSNTFGFVFRSNSGCGPRADQHFTITGHT
jgi:hypothetical protein